MPAATIAPPAVTADRAVPGGPAPWPARAVALLALAAAAVYLVWRWGFTLDGRAVWTGAPLAVAETYGIVMAALLAYTCWRMADRQAPAPLPGRRVAILVATFDEPEDVLRPTVLGALAVRNDVPPEVWVLDDGGREWVEHMCRELGARYVSRPAPRLGAKAGNLNHALAHVDAEFLVTLDADHVPRPELLERMLGYFADPRVAVVQAPQSFYNRGFGHPRADGDPFRNEQSVFFDVVLRGKDRHGAAFWCGCPAILRRQALEEVGGVATETVVEDAHTSLRLNAAGWRTVYHPERVAFGLAPEEIGAFMVQRARWARGSLQMLRRDNPLTKRGLTRAQRAEYAANSLHFLEGVQRLVAIAIPIAVLTTGIAPIAAAPLLYLALFAPQVVLIPVASRALTRGRYRPLESERYALVRMEPYLRALPALVGGAASFRVTPKGARARRASVARALRLPLALAAATVAALGYQTAAQLLDLPGRLPPGAHAVTVVWAMLNVALILWTFSWARAVHHRRRSHRFPVVVKAAVGPDGAGTPDVSARVEDLSLHGARLAVAAPVAPGERLRAVVLLDDGPVEVTGVAAISEPLPGGEGTRVGMAFDPLPPGAGDAILVWCFRHPVGPPAEAPPVAAPAPADAPGVTLAAAELAATEEPPRAGEAPPA